MDLCNNRIELSTGRREMLKSLSYGFGWLAFPAWREHVHSRHQ